MRPTMFVHLLGLWILLFSFALLPPIVIAAFYREEALAYFGGALLANVLVGTALWLIGSGQRPRFRVRDGFVAVVGLWVVTSVIASVPMAYTLDLSVTDAFFETVSGLTTTGATIIIGLDTMPRAALFFRQELQWLGGIGVIVSALALLPMLGVGGMQLFKAETPGPFKSEKLTPRIAHTAGVLWKLYLSMTALCALAYWLAGMSLFDAVAHSLTTVSTGGFSTHDASFAHFDNVLVEWIAIAFMLIGATSFGVHWMAWRTLSIERYRESEEIRAFLGIVLLLVALAGLLLYAQAGHDSPFSALRASAFTVVSVITSTGFGIENFALWPSFLPMLLMVISFVGGCGGSTAGGMKVMRFVILSKAIRREMFRLVHPSALRLVKLQGRKVGDRVLDAVMGFMCLYVMVYVSVVLVLLGLGLDMTTALSAVATSINNLGPGLGEVAGNFRSVPDAAKWILAVTMLVGRLEVMTFLVLLAPAFWRQ